MSQERLIGTEEIFVLQDGQPLDDIREEQMNERYRELKRRKDDLTIREEKVKRQEQSLEAATEQFSHREHARWGGLSLAIVSVTLLAGVVGLAMYSPLARQPDRPLLETPIVIPQVAGLVLLAAVAVVLVNVLYLLLTWILNRASRLQSQQQRSSLAAADHLTTPTTTLSNTSHAFDNT
jgi:CHASE3 domain sensor protein